jgi:hypothetical protein
VITIEFEMTNYNLTPSENIEMTINFGKVLLNLNVSRFLKLKSLKKIGEKKFLGEYNMCQFSKVLSHPCIIMI